MAYFFFRCIWCVNSTFCKGRNGEGGIIGSSWVFVMEDGFRMRKVFSEMLNFLLVGFEEGATPSSGRPQNQSHKPLHSPHAMLHLPAMSFDLFLLIICTSGMCMVLNLNF
jgi:hypothetical protein